MKTVSEKLVKQRTPSWLASVVLNRRMTTSFPEETGGKEERVDGDRGKFHRA